MGDFDDTFKEQEVNNDSQEFETEEKNYLSELVGDDKKFKTVDDLARGKAESDRFITRLQQEAEELRQELDKRSTIEDFMDRMNHKREDARTNDDEPNRRQTEHDKEEGNSRGFTQEELDQYLENKLKERENMSRLERNKQEVVSKMDAVWGRDASVELNKKAKELDMTVADLRKYAEDSPKAFYRLVGIDSQTEVQNQGRSNSFAPPSSSARLPDSRGADKNYSYYEKLRKENPREYFSAKVQNEMYRNASELGDKFYN